MKFEELLEKNAITDTTVLEIIDSNKYDNYLSSDDPTWKQFCDMHIFTVEYGDLKRSSVYDDCKNLEIVEKYRKEGALVLIVLTSEKMLSKLKNADDPFLIKSAEM